MGNKFSKYLEDRNITAYQLGKNSGASWKSVKGWIDGTVDIGKSELSTIFRVAASLGVPALDFIEEFILTPFDSIAYHEGWNKINEKLSLLLRDERVLKLKVNGELVKPIDIENPNQTLPYHIHEFISIYRRGRITW